MSAETIELRPITAPDRPVWSQLWCAYLDFYGTTLDQAAYDAAFDQLLSDDPATFQGLMAWDGDTALGLVHFVFHPHMWRPEGTCYLQDLFTAPEARGRGVARRLINAVYDAADDRGTPRVYWLTQETNYPGRLLYDRVGTRTGFIRYDRPAA